MEHDGTLADHDRIVTLDIETTDFEPDKGETVAIGVGMHEYGADAADAEYEYLVRSPLRDEAALIEEGVELVDDAGADALVTYNGIGFDLDFLESRAGLVGLDYEHPSLHAPETHVDLFAERKAGLLPNQKWPSLEDCLDTYGYPKPKTVWGDAELTNTRFGEELGPAIIDAAERDDQPRWEHLNEVLDHYLVTDLEANLAVYYGDRNVEFSPAYLDNPGLFDAWSDYGAASFFAGTAVLSRRVASESIETLLDIVAESLLIVQLATAGERTDLAGTDPMHGRRRKRRQREEIGTETEVVS